MDEAITLDDIRAELTETGRILLDQAIGSAMRAKQQQAELREMRGQLATNLNASQPVPPAGEPDA